MSADTARIPATSMMSPKINGGSNGSNGTNGYFSPPQSPNMAMAKKRSSMMSSGNSRVSSLNQAVRRSQVHGNNKISLVQENASVLKRKSMSELGSGVSQSTSDTSFINLVEWIRNERLATIPHKGSKWDKVLIRALYFAEQLHGFESAIQGFALESNAAAQLGYGHARLLLELGHENSEALDKAFGFFYKCSMTVASLLDRSDLLSVTSETREQLCYMYSDLLTLVVEVAVRFYKATHGMMSTEVSLDMYEVFGETIHTFRSRHETITDAIWSYQIESEGYDVDEAVDVKQLSRWLSPQDRVLAHLGRDHTTFSDQQAEFTCLWFQDDLSRFMKSHDHVMLVNGQSGAGKTTLAGSIMERLQRPLGRKSYQSLFCSVGAVPSQATTLHVVKSILFQLLNRRVGNMRLYTALVHAYEHARTCVDPKAYEDHLWSALAEALKHPLEQGNDLVMVIDGVDELLGGKSAGQELLQKLFHVCGQGKRVKLVALSQDLSIPSGTHGTEVKITKEETRDDVHAVVIRGLMHCKHFNSKPGQEQESIVNRIIEAADGSFLWASLNCEILKVEKTPEGFTQAVQKLQNSRPSVQELIPRLVQTLQPSDDAKTLLSFLVDSVRPLTYDEIEILFSIDIPRGIILEKRTDVHSLVESIKPLLSVHEDIVRVRHGQVYPTLRMLFDKGTVPLPIKDRQMDILLRSLIYAKTTLRERGEPTLDDSDQSLPDRLFHRHPLLEYVIRYWTAHLKQTPVAPSKTADGKVPAEVQKVFPDSVYMPVLEWLCWDAQFPGAEEVDLHIIVGRLRRQIFTENHPTVVQCYINIAAYYEMMDKPKDASTYYFWATTISRTVLSAFHPVTVECAIRYLRLTDQLVTTSRTEVMTHREQILIILITAYERQFGTTSDMVIQTREILAELYMYINERDRAAEILRIIHGTTVDKHGKDSHQARGLTDHLRLKLGKTREDKDMGIYEKGIFVDEDDEEAEEALDLGNIAIIIRRAEDYRSQGKISMAEQTYVELWQRISEYCRTTRSVQWHEQKIDVVTAYSKFLKTQKREIETSAVLTCLWQEYQHHELAFSESIITRLTETAQVMKSIGLYTAALSIFKHASSHYKRVRKEESRSFQQIEEEIAITSTEVVKHSMSSNSLTKDTNTVSESTFAEIFQSMITDHSKTVDETTMTLAKQLTVRYMEQKKWSEAVTVIQSTLKRTWSSFLATSIHDVTFTSTHWKQSVELVEFLAQCYLEQRLFERVEDVYVRLFRAVLTSPPNDNTVLEKVKTLLITFYDKHGYPDKAISIFQEILVVYRRKLGPSHEITIQTLYTLADRCRAHARSHPYWVEYCLQIVQALNKDSDICHVMAMDALVVVANSYWEERRYAEAVTVFHVLWSTFIKKTKEYEQFKSEKFVRDLYERYFQCLEETKSDFEVLYRVTKEYRSTVHQTFGAKSTLAVVTTVALARVSQRSETHMEESISLYEEASHSSSSTSTSEERSFDASEIKKTLTTMYKRRITAQASSTVSSETIQKATSIYQEQFTENKSKYGYSHEMTLTQLHELSMLYVRQQKTDVAVKELTTAVVEINTKETSSQKMLESASSIAQTFMAIKQEERCRELVQELHRQIIARDAKNSKFSFNLTKCSSASLMFLAALEYNIATHFVTFSEIFADIMAEYTYFENFRKVMKANDDLDKILLAAAPLRYFLIKRGRKHMVASMEEDIVQLFIKRDTEGLKLLSKDSPRIFIIGILDHLGNRKAANFVRAVILASNHSLARLIEQNRFRDAYDVANIAFLFAKYHKGYHGPRAISRGFELASYLDGRGENRCPEEGLRKQLLQLSNSIVKEILQICKDQKINFAQVQLAELNELIALLGEQQDWETLEWLLNELWNTRDAQKNWPSSVLQNLGRRLICVRFLANHPIKALRLCEDISYNMRRVHGARHPATLETYALLAQLYTSAGLQYQKTAANDKSAAALATEYFKKAVLVHEDILKWMLGGKSTDDGDDDEDTAASILKDHGISIDEDDDGVDDEEQVDRPALVKQHLKLLKLAYQRLGKWPKNYATYETLNADVFRTFASDLKGIEGVEKWNAKSFGSGKAESNDDEFKGVNDWEILGPIMRREMQAKESDEKPVLGAGA